MAIRQDVEVDVGGQLYRLHREAITRFATGVVGPSDAADVVHNAMASLIATDRLQTAENPRALLYSAVLNHARSHQRSMFRRRHRERKFASAVVASDPEIMPEIAAAVASLSLQQRACVFLAYWEDLTPAQIGNRLAIAEGTVKHHLARARGRLREVLSD